MSRIAIVGTAQPSCDLAPYEDPDWTIWGLAWRTHRRADLLFDMHDPCTWQHHGGPGYLERLASLESKVILASAVPELPRAQVYPRDAVVERLSKFGDAAVFTSSLSFMLALAICQNENNTPTQIGVFGCDLASNSEYAYQRPAMEYLIGLARGRGANVYIPAESSLCKANFTYGDLSASQNGLMQQAKGVTEKLLITRLSDYEKQKAEAHDRMMGELNRMHTLDGAIQECTLLLDQVRHFNRGGVIPGS